jgi:hypothetical protein
MRYVILRDDDTCAFTPPGGLELLYGPALRAGLPVTLSVVPAVTTRAVRLDGEPERFLGPVPDSQEREAPLADNRDLVKYLKDNKDIRLAQHGCTHSPFEFDAPGRAGLAARLERGTLLLEQAGLSRPAAFVAPYDRLSRAGFLEVAARFPVISTGWFERGRVPLRWWPGLLARKLAGRPHWRAGGACLLSHPGCLLSRERSYPGMAAAVRRAVESSSLTVLVTHWWEYFPGGQPDQAFIQVLHEVLDWLAHDRGVRVVGFEEVRDGQVPLA